jgi:hypothetical protein
MYLFRPPNKQTNKQTQDKANYWIAPPPQAQTLIIGLFLFIYLFFSSSDPPMELPLSILDVPLSLRIAKKPKY